MQNEALNTARTHRRPPQAIAIRLLAMPGAAQHIKRLGRPGGFDRNVQEELAQRLSSPAHQVEPKGAGYFGIDLRHGNRAVFALNEDRQPVLIYFGDHRGYDALQLSSRKSFNLSSAREVAVRPPSADRVMTAEEFGNSFLEAAGFGLTNARHRTPNPRLLSRNRRAGA
jgi:hypothetical protein